jgi:hypothetical protein
MNGGILLGYRHHMIPVPGFVWKRAIKAAARKARAGLAFMSTDHHRVRDFVVTELPRVAAPLSPDLVARKLSLSIDRVNAMLEELERHLTFLYRNAEGAVTWAYPVTVDETPHHATFNTGEHAYSP